MVLMSSIVRIKFWNPDTYAELTSADPFGSGMLLTLWGKETNGTYVVSMRDEIFIPKLFLSRPKYL